MSWEIRKEAVRKPRTANPRARLVVVQWTMWRRKVRMCDRGCRSTWARGFKRARSFDRTTCTNG
eukprot:9467576-Pyramimonas_sp.AAC.1